MPISVMVAEDNQLMRLGLRTLIATADDLQVVGETSDGPETITRYAELLPDVLLLDLRMPVMDGFQVARHIIRGHPAARILVLTHSEGDEPIAQALEAGAQGYLTKETPGPLILAAIRAIFAGEQQLPPEVAERLLAREKTPALTGRERQVLGLVAEGLTNRGIAESLGLSDRTIAIFVGNLLWKLGAKTRTEAVAIGTRRGLLAPRG